MNSKKLFVEIKAKLDVYGYIRSLTIKWEDEKYSRSIVSFLMFVKFQFRSWRASAITDLFVNDKGKWFIERRFNFL